MISSAGDLEIRLSHREGDTYAVRLVYTPADSAGSTQPLGDRPAIATFDLEALKPLALDPDGYGRLLTEGLLTEDRARQAFSRILANVAGSPLRVRVAIDGDARQLHAVRWELLRHPDQDRPWFWGQLHYLSRSPSTRDMRPVRLHTQPDLRALVIVSNPSDIEKYAPEGTFLAPIDVEAELARAKDALAPIELTTIPSRSATLPAITSHLQDGYDIVYLVAHGAHVNGEPKLWLENEDGSVHVVDGNALVQRVVTLSRLPLLVVLASCQTAGDGTTTIAAESSVVTLGPSLAAAGVPAVLAMQGNITVETLAALLPAFFKELLESSEVDRALAVARQAVERRHDWWMPTLFMRLRDGRLWLPPAETARSPQINTLPPAPADFTGREREVAEIMSRATGTAPFISGVRGIGGVGKTALTLVVAHQIGPHYPGAALYIDLRGATSDPVAVRDAQIRIIQQLRPTTRVPDGDDEIADLYRATLRPLTGLLLLDDACDAAQVRPLLPPEDWALLITSRRRFPLPGLHPVNLSELPTLDARDLLQRITPRLADEQADEIARLCGRLPLALRLAGSYLQSRPADSPDDYIRRLGDQTHRIARLDTALQLDSELPAIEAVLQISYDRLSSEQQSRWSTLAVFPASFNTLAAAAIWGLLPKRDDATAASYQIAIDTASDLLGALGDFSMVEPDLLGRYRVHDLARLFAGHHLGDAARGSAARRHAEHFLSVLEVADSQYLAGGAGVAEGLEMIDCEWSNILAAQAWSVAHAAESPEIARLVVDYPSTGVHVLSLRHHPRTQIAWLEAAVTTARLIGDRRGEAAALGNLGFCFGDVNELSRAVELHEQALAIAREIGDRSGEGIALGNLGLCYAELGESRRAMELSEQRLVIARDTGDRRGEATALSTLGICYAELGEPRRAIECLEQRLAIAREIGDRRGEGAALGNLGVSYAKFGEPGRAIELHEQALAIAREMGYRWGEATALSHLGDRYAELSEPGHAIDLYEQALAIAREFGDRHSEAVSLSNLGYCYVSLGEPLRAIDLYEQVLLIRRDLGDRRGEGIALFNISLCQESLGNHAAAIHAAEASLEILAAIGSSEAERARTQLDEMRTKLGRDDQPEGETSD